MERKVLFQTLMTLVSFAALAAFVDFSLLFEQIQSFSLEVLAILLVATILRLILGGMRCLRTAPNPNNLGLGICIEGYLLSAFCSLFLPSAIGGDAVRIEHLSQKGGLSRPASSAVVIWERASGLLAMVLFLCAAILVAPTILDGGQMLVGASIALSIGIVVSLAIVSRLGLEGRAPAWWVSFTGTLREIRNPIQFVELVSWSLLAQAVTIAIPFSIGLLASGGGWDTALLLAAITPIVWLVTMIPISLGGNGLREVSYLGAADLFGIDPIIALSAALALTLSNILAAICGFFAFNNWSKGHKDDVAT